ncbi:MAG: dTMP kinase [Desulfovibrionales bacterium]|nr:dTMP kinase [Desulfovibrionales bacterium]
MGKFIVFEGIDGSGKSTQLMRIKQRFGRKGIKVKTTCEPSDGPVGRLIRTMLSGDVSVDQRTLAALFAADRTDHLLNAENGVKALVDAGETVLCDRYYFSSYAYHAQYMDMEQVIGVNAQNASILKPWVTFFIDVDPALSLERIRQSRTQLDIYEKIEILERVRELYLKAFDRFRDEEKVIIVDGNGSLEQVEERIWTHICRLIPGVDGE